MQTRNAGCGGRRVTYTVKNPLTHCLLFAALLCLLLSGASCRRAGGTAFVMVLEAGQKTLDPLRGTDASSERYRQLMFNQLMRKNEQFDYVGELASNVQTAPDGLSVTFTLQDNVKFHDGKPLTSADVKYTFDKFLASDSPKAVSFFEGAGANKQPLISGVDAPDPRTAVFRLRRPWLELFANLIPIAIIPEGTFESQAIKPIGSGAFKFVSYDESQQVVELEANDNYWEGAPNIKRLRVKVILDANTQQAELVAGRVDLAVNTALSPDAYVNLGRNQNLQIVQSPGVNVQYIGFNSESAPVNNARVRQAIAYAIDRESIIKNLLQGQARIAHSILPQESWAYSPEQKTYTYDPAQAKKLLDEAGFDRSTPVDLWFNAGAGHEEWMQAVGNQIRENLGIEYQLRGDLQQSEFLPLKDAQGMTGPFRDAWIMDYPVAENFLGPLYSSAALPPAGSNYTFYSNPEFDRLLTEANGADTEEAAVQGYQAAEDVLLADLPSAPLFYRLNQGAHSENVDNVIIDAFGRIDAAAVEVVQ